MDTAELRARYLVQNLFVADEIQALYTHHDRIVLAGVSPVTKALELATFPEIRSDFFFEHREGGIVNVGGTGTITVDGTEYQLTKGSCLYIGRGAHAVVMASSDPTGAPGAARFYLNSRPPTPHTRPRSLRPATETYSSSATRSPQTAAS